MLTCQDRKSSDKLNFKDPTHAHTHVGGVCSLLMRARAKTTMASGALYRRLASFLGILSLTLLDSVLSLPVYKLYLSSGDLFTSKSRGNPPSSSRTTPLQAVTTRKSNLVLESGKTTTIRSRLVPITDSWNVTVWEWDEPSSVMEHYWNSQHGSNFGVRHEQLLDPFGLVSWPGSVVAAQELSQLDIEGLTVLILGAGPGVEAQAAAMLGAKRVIASDIHPTTLQLLRYGAQEAGLGLNESVIETRGMSFTCP